MNLRKPSFSWYLQVSFSYHRQSGSGVDKHLMRCSPIFDKRFRHSYHSVQTNTRFCCSAIWNWFLAELFVRTFNIKYFWAFILEFVYLYPLSILPFITGCVKFDNIFGTISLKPYWDICDVIPLCYMLHRIRNNFNADAEKFLWKEIVFVIKVEKR